MAQELSYPKNKIKILLLENIHQVAVEALRESGYSVKEIKKSLPPEELLEEIKDVHILGIRSKTKVRAEHFEAANRLLAVGCFGVGTNQVDLDAAMKKGVPVFNAPYGNTRSVAELTLGSLIMVARKAGEAGALLKNGHWKKTAKGCHEIRTKPLALLVMAILVSKLELLLSQWE